VRLKLSPDDNDIAELHADYAVTRDRRQRDALLAHYDPFAVHLVRTFRSRREESDDLVQVARIGLIHALDRFDPDRGLPFTGFARATIVGELKRHVRDHTWRVHVGRTLQERCFAVLRATDELTQELGRRPLVSEVAARTAFTQAQVLEAMEVARSLAPVSADETLDWAALGCLTGHDAALQHVENEQTVRSVVAMLPERSRLAVRLRFEQELTQAEIAAQLGVAQMSISRLLTRSMRRMRLCLEAEI
jgi:RNA polymerase sigma-B factor